MERTFHWAACLQSSCSLQTCPFQRIWFFLVCILESAHLWHFFKDACTTTIMAFLSEQCKEIEEKDRMEKTRDLFKKIRDTKGTLHA